MRYAESRLSALHFIQLIVGALVVKFLLIYKSIHAQRLALSFWNMNLHIYKMASVFLCII